MAPMNWLILFIYFMITFYIIMNLMYFNFIKIMKKKNWKKSNNIKNYNKFI
uniref:ATP synthase subunit 8 n=1 Tax=Eriosoma lanigerum TaxID=133082 RepID=A0A1L1YMJ3_ERILA|nr:ATP synthase subunit 8 [Eriosoma lanigerum]AKM70160.1 ATP synthase subunit 8 [Eriosoma lanigerum]